MLFTDFSHGTPGYRAPELLKESKGSFNNKLDIWAMGCILYELATGKKQFLDDWSVREFAANGDNASNIPFKETVHQSTRALVSGAVQDMLQT